MTRIDDANPQPERRNYRRPLQLPLAVVKTFVQEAKLAGFASTDQKTTLPDQSSVYSHRRFTDPRFGGMIYTDRYMGNTIEAGQETVSLDLVVRWRNQYYGGTAEPFWDPSLRRDVSGHDSLGAALIATGPRFPEVVSAFLKQALTRLPEDFPVRGPRRFAASEVTFENEVYEADWQYVNEWWPEHLYVEDDPFAGYRGQERILVNGTPVYGHAYHGGVVRDKYFPVQVTR